MRIRDVLGWVDRGYVRGGENSTCIRRITRATKGKEWNQKAWLRGGIDERGLNKVENGRDVCK